MMLKMKYFNSQTKCISDALTLICDHCLVTNLGKHKQNSEKQKFPQTRCEPVGSGSAFQSIGPCRHWNIQRKEKVKCTIFFKFAFWFPFLEGNQISSVHFYQNSPHSTNFPDVSINMADASFSICFFIVFFFVGQYASENGKSFIFCLFVFKKLPCYSQTRTEILSWSGKPLWHN